MFVVSIWAKKYKNKTNLRFGSLLSLTGKTCLTCNDWLLPGWRILHIHNIQSISINRCQFQTYLFTNVFISNQCYLRALFTTYFLPFELLKGLKTAPGISQQAIIKPNKTGSKTLYRKNILLSHYFLFSDKYKMYEEKITKSSK